MRLRRAPCALPLAKITNERISYDKCWTLKVPPDKDWEEAMSWLTGKKIRENLSPEKAEDQGHGVSRHLLREVPSLLKWGVLRDPSGRPLMYIPLFKVPKSDQEWARLIADCRPINSRLPRPGNMKLPDLHALIDMILSQKYLFEADGVTYFYQFTIDGEAMLYFGVRIGNERGEFKVFVISVMSMGYSHAPRAAQAMSNLVCKNVMHHVPECKMDAWVDNFIGGSQTQQGAENGKDALLQTCGHINLRLKELPQVRRELDAIGMHFDVRSHPCARLSTKTRSWLREWRAPTTWTPRQLLQVFGSLMWANHSIGRIPLSYYDDVLQQVRKVAIKMAQKTSPSEWDAPLNLNDGVEHRIQEWVTSAEAYVYFVRPHEGLETVSLWSDASGGSCPHWGYVLSYGKQNYGNHADAPVLDIYLLELLAAADLLYTCDKMDRPLKIHIDNTTAAAILRKGHSCSAAGNLVMKKLLDNTQRPTWEVVVVPSECERADALSRRRWQIGPLCDHDHPTSQTSWRRPGENRGEPEKEGGTS